SVLTVALDLLNKDEVPTASRGGRARRARARERIKNDISGAGICLNERYDCDNRLLVWVKLVVSVPPGQHIRWGTCSPRRLSLGKEEPDLMEAAGIALSGAV